MRGSVLPRTVPVAVLPTLLSIVLLLIDRLHVEDLASMLPIIEHPFAVQIFAFLLSYFAVLRTKIAVSRYFQGITEVQIFGSKWGDAYTQMCAFIRSSAKQHHIAGRDEHMKELEVLQKQLLHMFSLLHALAINALQARQLNLDENCFMSRINVIRSPNFDLLCTEDRKLIDQWKNRRSQKTRMQSRIRPSEVNAARTTILEKVVQNGRRLLRKRLYGGRKSVKVAKMGSAALGRQSVGMLGSFYEGAQDRRDELSSLTIVGGLQGDEIRHLKDNDKKVELVHVWILERVSDCSLRGILLQDSSILSRVYQELSNGVLGFNQAYKIALIQYPFACAQMLTLFLVGFLFFCPVTIWRFSGGAFLTPAFTFLAILGFWGADQIACELEDPYGVEVNHLPLASLHETVAKMLVQVTVGKQPPQSDYVGWPSS
jgi:predicted membrane chloride channel (bestrophin family)